jgi:hypothetical protein
MNVHQQRAHNKEVYQSSSQSSLALMGIIEKVINGQLLEGLVHFLPCLSDKALHLDDAEIVTLLLIVSHQTFHHIKGLCMGNFVHWGAQVDQGVEVP